jgi:acetylornithine deacetylase
MDVSRLMDPIEKHVLSAVDGLADEILDFTERLVAEPSTLGHEKGALAVMEAELNRLGWPATHVPIDSEGLSGHPGFAPVPWQAEERFNLAATRPADGAGGSSALFNGHLDVVSPEPLSHWQADPFKPYEKDGWLYGRGAGDMKAGIAAMTYALRAVEKAGAGLRGPVTIEGVIEEECSGNGALACMAAGYDADAVLIPEPFGPTILAAQVGVAWFKVSVNGVPQHVLETQGGVNAIEKCYPIIQALRSLEAENNRQVLPPFDALNHPANLNIGIIKGGDWPSTVPAAAEFHCRIGFLPGTTFDQTREKVLRCIGEAAKKDAWLSRTPPEVQFYGFRSEGLVLNRDLPAFQTLNTCHRDLTGEDARSHFCTATTDLRAFVHYGRGQATCFGPVAENIHAGNERVHIGSILHTARVYALFLCRWCGVVR